jgi:hypothetical protein
MPTARPDDEPFTTTEKVMQTFRLPRDLVAFHKDEANRAGRDLTAHVSRWLEGVRNWFGLPVGLEADRKALRMERYEYVLHLLFQRSLDVREKGPGYDTPSEPARKRR